MTTFATGLSPDELDAALRRCAEEPIHTPGVVQPHGALLAATEADGRVAYASASAARVLGVVARECLGRPLTELLPGFDLDAAAPRQNLTPRRITAEDGRPLAAFAHRHGGFVIVEVEDAGPAALQGEEDSACGHAAYLEALAQARSEYDVAAATVARAAALTGFDRCMFYRFLPDWSGDVIAELRGDDMIPYLGLRYPASDIPEQARRLYLNNVYRAVAEVDAEASPLIAAPSAGGAALDLTYANLRAVSPVHLQYLRNMGVAASLTGSIIVDGRLWGLAACHHRGRRLTPPWEREMFAQTVAAAASAIARIEAGRRAALDKRVAGRLKRIEGILGRTDDNVALRLLTDDPGLGDLAGADGAAMAVDGRVLTFGISPDVDAVRTLAARLGNHGDDPLATDCLSDHPAAADLDLGPAVGMLATAARGADGRTLTLLAFRGELVRDVFWGGDPNKPVSADGEKLEPRASFSLWRQTVAGHSREWDDDGVSGWRELKRRLEDPSRQDGLIDRIAADIDRLALGVDSQEALVRSCVNAIAQPSIVARHDAAHPCGRTLAANRAFRAAFQILAEEVEGATLPDLTRALGFDPDAVTSLPPGAGVNAAVRTAGAGDRWFTINHRPLLCVGAGMNQSALSLWSLEDITGFRRVEDALRAAQRKTAAADRAKSALIAGVSHELRTPLNAIIGFSEMMVSQVFGDLGDERYLKYAEHIYSSSQHLLSVISDVLDATRIERGVHALDEEDFDLAQTFADCCAMAEQLAARRGVALQRETTPSTIMMRGDPRAMRQILLNLMSNAVKFTPSGGRVRCRALGFPGEAACIQVADNGVGIADDNHARVFEPFYQESDRLDLASGGLGLGLALVKVLTELHGGVVRLESRKGVGTTIDVQFPLWRTANPCQSVADLHDLSANI